jgi:hypothetical protein
MFIGCLCNNTLCIFITVHFIITVLSYQDSGSPFDFERYPITMMPYSCSYGELDSVKLTLTILSSRLLDRKNIYAFAPSREAKIHTIAL